MNMDQLWAGGPWLPDPDVVRMAMRVQWALVLGVASLWLGTRLRVSLRWSLAVIVVMWTCLPGMMSPAYWLGLAFQSPSLTSGVLCLMYGVQQWRKRVGQPRVGVTASVTWQVLWGAGVVVGWMLLMDMLAWWPVSLYAWGFHPVALATVCMVVLTVWLTSRSDRNACAGLSVVLVVFVVTRLPSGNVWDALLDPWLWMVLQATAWQQAWRWRHSRSQGVIHQTVTSTVRPTVPLDVVDGAAGF